MSASVWPKAVPLLILACLLAYANCITKTLVFDDDAWIVDVPALDDPPQYFRDMEGRPLLAVTNLTLHRFGRSNPVGHHVLNVLIHIGATLTLYGVVRRSLLRPRFCRRFEGRAPYLAFAVALLWMLHPLQVQCVTYVIQRGESMAGLFYMLILYGMLRADEERDPDDDTDLGESYNLRRFIWYFVAIASLVLGFASKEILATAPVAVVLFDRIFVAQSWRELIRRRWIFYLFFLSIAGAFVAWHLDRAAGSQGGIGFGMQTITKQQYAYTQAGVILYYLQLSVWPRGMAIDYQSWPWSNTLSEAMPEGAIIAGMLLVTSVLLFWRPALGFVCAWFFIILAPTSSVMPIADAVFEHRMYLSLATVAIIVVFLGDWFFRRVRLGRLRPVLLTAVAIALGVLTHLRNEEYRSRAAVWQTAVERMPNSVRARSNFGQGLIIAERYDEVPPILNRGLEISPSDPTTLVNLGATYEQLGRYDLAEDCYRRMRDYFPSDPKHWRMHAASLLNLGRWHEANEVYGQAIKLSPGDLDAHYGRAAALREMGIIDQAEEEAKAASAIDPAWPEYVLSSARTVILDENMRCFPEARRSAMTWAKLGMRYLDSPRAPHRDTLGLCYAAHGDFDRAAEQARLSLEEFPSGAWGSMAADRLRDYSRKKVPWPKP
jgi:tetratricopeptide (TPR) repeat protein